MICSKRKPLWGKCQEPISDMCSSLASNTRNKRLGRCELQNGLCQCVLGFRYQTIVVCNTLIPPHAFRANLADSVGRKSVPCAGVFVFWLRKDSLVTGTNFFPTLHPLSHDQCDREHSHHPSDLGDAD